MNALYVYLLSEKAGEWATRSGITFRSDSCKLSSYYDQSTNLIGRLVVPAAASHEPPPPHLNVTRKIYYSEKMKTYENPLTNHIQQEDAAPMSYKRIK